MTQDVGGVLRTYRKKSVVVEAIQWNGCMDVFNVWLDPPDGGSVGLPFAPLSSGLLEIETLEGDMHAKPGDWIIKGTAGEYYPCKPEIFEAIYEPVSEDQ